MLERLLLGLARLIRRVDEARPFQPICTHLPPSPPSQRLQAGRSLQARPTATHHLLTSTASPATSVIRHSLHRQLLRLGHHIQKLHLRILPCLLLHRRATSKMRLLNKRRQRLELDPVCSTLDSRSFLRSLWRQTVQEHSLGMRISLHTPNHLVPLALQIDTHLRMLVTTGATRTSGGLVVSVVQTAQTREASIKVSLIHFSPTRITLTLTIGNAPYVDPQASLRNQINMPPPPPGPPPTNSKDARRDSAQEHDHRRGHRGNDRGYTSD